MANSPPFNLIRWFLLLSLVCVGLVGIGTSMLLSRFLTDRMLLRDAEMLQEFLQSTTQFQHAIGYFQGHEPASSHLEEFFKQIGLMPDVIRANVYSPEKQLIWSTEGGLAGKHFEHNEELELSLNGQIAIETGTTGKEQNPKAEHLFLGRGSTVAFVENYLPIRDPGTGRVVGVVEVYRVPRALFEAIHEGERLIWIAMALGGLFLYVCLFWIVRRADLIIRSQQERLVESETLAALGEMAGAVAHGIRNPLASIRSSAELMQWNGNEAMHESARDIVDEVDRLERWVRDLLVYSQPEQSVIEAVNVKQLLDEALSAHSREIDRRAIRLRVDCAEDLPPIHADFNLLAQALNSLLSNAIEALPDGGDLSVGAGIDSHARAVRITIMDNGAGIPDDQIANVFRPFYTTKQKGLGVGLPLAKRIIKRYRGSIEISSNVGTGTSVTVFLPLRS